MNAIVDDRTVARYRLRLHSAIMPRPFERRVTHLTIINDILDFQDRGWTARARWQPFDIRATCVEQSSTCVPKAAEKGLILPMIDEQMPAMVIGELAGCGRCLSTSSAMQSSSRFVAKLSSRSALRVGGSA
jgi:hypothetical protein